LLGVAAALWHGKNPKPATGSNTPQTEAASPSNAPAIRSTNLIDRLKSASDAATAGRWLMEFRRELAGMQPKEASLFIQQLLLSKKDASTRLGFKVGNSGWLAEAPTARVFLLDELGRIDPQAAAEFAKTLLASMDSPDEWAVALRNLARGDATPEGRAMLAAKTQQMLEYAPWQQNPSVGYLEAFDAAVYLGGTTLLPTISNLVRREDNAAVTHAAFLALDRLVINDANATLTALAASPELMQGRELTRADYFARADVRDPQQRRIVEEYLLSPNNNAAELRQFTGIFPNANYMISQNLLTSTATPDSAALESRDAESLRALDLWLADPRFARLQPQLRQIKQRLEAFTQQANGQ
jgi:hypothetical protein